MDKFISLEEFLLLSDPSTKGWRRSIFNGGTLNDDFDFGKDFVDRYKIAKKSWEKYGDKGPDPGCDVSCLLSGCGGPIGVRRHLKGKYKDEDKFFELTNPFKPGESYIIPVQQWWAWFQVIEKETGHAEED